MFQILTLSNQTVGLLIFTFLHLLISLFCLLFIFSLYHLYLYSLSLCIYIERGKMVDRHTSSLYSRTSSSNSTKYPSFSSTLLDSIYRSFDLGEEEMAIYNYRDVMAKKKMKKDCNSVSVNSGGADAKVRGVLFRSEEEMANFERACMIEKWMEKKAAGEKMVRRKSMAVVDLQMKKSRKDDRENSSFSSSDSSCGGGGMYFSSSEPESFSLRRPQTIHQKGKTAQNHRDFEINRRERPVFADQSEQKPKNDGGFLKTKSRALKIYGDLKKVKQPISPGGRLATFINSLFTAGNSKKHKTAANPSNSPTLSKSANASTCSSASSFSRSCLSKTPSSRGKPSNITKRSVKFLPVSMIVDEHSDQPCGHKSLHQENRIKKQKQISDDQTSNSNNDTNSIRAAIDEQLMVHIMANNRRVEEAAMDLLRKTHFQNQSFDQDFDEEDDAESYASSDLFELDNLSAIGMEELPVYETTFLGTKRDNTIKGLIT